MWGGGHGAYANPSSTTLGPYFAELVCRTCGRSLPLSASLALSQAHVEKKPSNVGLLLRPFQPMLGQCGATLVYVGTVLGHVVSYIGPMLC